MAQRRVINIEGGVPAKGPYSNGVAIGDLLFLSGQVALDIETGELKGDTTADQVRLAFQNIQATLEACGSSLAEAIKITLYLADIADFPAANEVYAEFFEPGNEPARTTIQAGALPLGARCEIDVIARIPE